MQTYGIRVRVSTIFGMEASTSRRSAVRNTWGALLDLRPLRGDRALQQGDLPTAAIYCSVSSIRLHGPLTLSLSRGELFQRVPFMVRQAHHERNVDECMKHDTSALGGGGGNRAVVGAAETTLKYSVNDVFKVAVSIGRLTPYGLARAP